MKILVINYEYPPLGGGGGVFTRDLADELAKTNEIDVITTHMKGLPKEEEKNNVTIYRVPVFGRTNLSTSSLPALLSFVPSCVKKGEELLKTKKYDLIHTHFAIPSGPAGVFLSKRFNMPHVLSIYGGDVYDPSKKMSPHRHALLRWTVRQVMNRSTKVVAESKNIKNNATQIYRPADNIDIIPLGIPKLSFTASTRKALGLDENKTYLISVGRLVKRKGYDFLIKALSLIKKQAPDTGIILVGDGPELFNLKQLAADLKIENDILFLTAADDKMKFEYLYASDIYVLSSTHEGFGIVILEAMFAGLAIVATDEGGQTDIITDRKNGLLVKPSDPDALANAVLSLMNNRALIEKMSAHNLKDIENYSIKNVASKYLEYFKKTIETKRPRA